ncbi:hypothetical protein ES711_05075 [Gelidibacter salicanalis]|uniref:Lipocalin-like domain-containing protein n=1 Tax=Gelidibacter salicanalis TaxID=291193 RepID=A0A5C7AMX6_9FLAO|nr:hypothetical protein [Gelidibacter salicanalis]TXE09304.1 hypothetical protein ES711_05075 [Gelidibacter salicanalis]
MRPLYNSIEIGLLLFFLVSSCSKSTPPADFYVTNLTSGSWIITQLLLEGPENHADIFDGYVFTFLENRMVRATKNGSTSKGQWQLSHVDFSTYLILKFEGSGDIEKLNKTWTYYGNGLDHMSLHNDNWSEVLVFSKQEYQTTIRSIEIMGIIVLT